MAAGGASRRWQRVAPVLAIIGWSGLLGACSHGSGPSSADRPAGTTTTVRAATAISLAAAVTVDNTAPAEPEPSGTSVPIGAPTIHSFTAVPGEPCEAGVTWTLTWDASGVGGIAIYPATDGPDDGTARGQGAVGSTTWCAPGDARFTLEAATQRATAP